MNTKAILDSIAKDQIRTDLPELEVGSTVKVHVKVKEGNRERIQIFEGTIIKIQHGGIQKTFTVRRLSYGIGVERTFPVNSPIIDKVVVVRHGKVRRAVLEDILATNEGEEDIVEYLISKLLTFTDLPKEEYVKLQKLEKDWATNSRFLTNLSQKELNQIDSALFSFIKKRHQNGAVSLYLLFLLN